MVQGLGVAAWFASLQFEFRAGMDDSGQVLACVFSTLGPFQVVQARTRNSTNMWFLGLALGWLKRNSGPTRKSLTLNLDV